LEEEIFIDNDEPAQFLTATEAPSPARPKGRQTVASKMVVM